MEVTEVNTNTFTQ